MYLDSRNIPKSTGMSARMRGKVGGRFRAFKGMLEGKNLLIVPGRQIVQLLARDTLEERGLVAPDPHVQSNSCRRADRSRARGSAALRSRGSAGRVAEILLEGLEEVFGEVIEKYGGRLVSASGGRVWR